jgi:prophage tail gpP-like protein
MATSDDLDLQPPDTSVEIWVSDKDDPTSITRLKRWNSYNISVGIMEPAGTFQLDFAGDKQQRDQISSTGGQRVSVYSHDALQMRGIVDERSDATNKTNTDNQITGRSMSGLLVDSAIPSRDLNLSGLTLAKLAKKWIAPWVPEYIPNVLVNNAASRYIMAGGSRGSSKGGLQVINLIGTNPLGIATPVSGEFIGWQAPKKGKKRYGKFGKNSPYFAGISTDTLRTTRLQPGAKVWQSLMTIAEQIGAHVWQGADGSIIIARPTYDFDPTAYGETLKLQWDTVNDKALGGNIEEVRLDTSIAERASEYKIISSVKSKKGSSGSELFHTKTIQDPGPAFWDSTGSTNRLLKPDVINAKKLSSAKIVSRLARRVMCSKVMSGLSYSVLIAGHHSESGALWVPDSMVQVDDQRNNINQAMYITKVQRKFDRSAGRTTMLDLIPPDIWLGKFDDDSIPSDTFDKEMRKRVWW